MWPYNLFLTASEFEMQLSFNFLLCYLWKSCKHIRHLKLGKLNLRLKMRLTAQIHKKCNSWCSLTLLHNQILNLTPSLLCLTNPFAEDPLYPIILLLFVINWLFFTCGTDFVQVSLIFHHFEGQGHKNSIIIYYNSLF